MRFCGGGATPQKRSDNQNMLVRKNMSVLNVLILFNNPLRGYSSFFLKRLFKLFFIYFFKLNFSRDLITKVKYVRLAHIFFVNGCLQCVSNGINDTFAGCFIGRNLCQKLCRGFQTEMQNNMTLAEFRIACYCYYFCNIKDLSGMLFQMSPFTLEPLKLSLWSLSREQRIRITS